MIEFIIAGLIGITHRWITNHLSKTDPTMNLLVAVLAGALVGAVTGNIEGLVLSFLAYSVAYWGFGQLLP